MSNLADLLFAPPGRPDADPGVGGPPASDRPLVHWRGDTYTRAEIADAAERLADTLRRMGVAPDSAVVAVVPSTPLGLVVLFGIWRAGAAVAPLAPEPDDRPDRLDRLVADVRPAAVVRPSLDEASLVPQVTVTPGTPRHYDDAVALVLATDAAGGHRRLLLDHGAVRASLDAASGTLRDAPGARLVPLPLVSRAGADASLLATRAGDAVVLLDGCNPAELAEAVRAFGVVSTLLPVTMAAALTDDPTVAALEPLRHVRIPEAGVSADEARRFRARFGVTLVGGYGRADLGGEVVGWTVGDVAVDGDVKLGARGRPYAGVVVRIVRDDRTAAATDEPGEIWVRSPFAPRADPTDLRGLGSPADADGFVHTGAVGWLDRDGFLWSAPGPE